MAVGYKGFDMDCTPVDLYITWVGVCTSVDIRLHACGYIQCSLANQGLIFSLVLLYYFTLSSYVYNCTQWQRRILPA